MADTNNYADIAAAIAGLIAGQHYSNQGMNANVPPQLSQLLDQSVQRQNAQTPLFGAVNSGIYQMLPTYARNGASQFMPSGPSTPFSGSDGPGIGTTAGTVGIASIISLLRNLYKNSPGGAANQFVGPKQESGQSFGAGAGGGGGEFGTGPGSPTYNFLSRLAQSGISGMFTGAAGGGLGTPGDQTYFAQPPGRAKAY